MDKLLASAQDAVAMIPSGSSIAVGGFGMCGVPTVLIEALREAGVHDLEIVSNNCGAQGWGLATLLKDRRIRRVVASYFGNNEDFANQYLAGELEVELNPQGTLAERLRAGGPASRPSTPPPVSALRSRSGACLGATAPMGRSRSPRPPKETRVFAEHQGERTFVLERSITTDFALVRAARGDRMGNLSFHGTAQNFNPLCAMAGRTTIAEVEELVEPGELSADAIHLPGIFVQHVIELTPEQVAVKEVEFRTIRDEVSP